MDAADGRPPPSGEDPTTTACMWCVLFPDLRAPPRPPRLSPAGVTKSSGPRRLWHALTRPAAAVADDGSVLDDRVPL